MKETYKHKPLGNSGNENGLPIGDIGGEELPKSGDNPVTKQHPTLPVGND